MIRCPHCNAGIDDDGLELYARVVCPSCTREFRANAWLGSYEMTALIGVGGMSLVFKARDLMLGREIALKVLNREYRSDPRRTARFERECALMAKVRHAHVVRVYTAGQENGFSYIAMELVDGSDVEAEIARRGAFSPLEALRIVRQAAEGLRAAHQAGLIHRDMKPGNILLTAEREAKVADFGLALLRGEDDFEEQIWATPHYVSPETLRREHEDVRSDMYSLGMTLRHMLTGEPPFAQGATSVRSLLAIKRRLPPLRRKAPALPRALCGLAEHMTAFARWRRPGGYAALMREIEETAAAVRKELETGKPRRTPAQRRRLLILPAAAAAIALSLLAVLIGAHSEPDRRAPKTHAAAPAGNADIGRTSSIARMLARAEQAVADARFDEAARLFGSLTEISFYTVRTWSTLQAFNCLYLLGDEARIRRLLRLEAVSAFFDPEEGGSKAARAAADFFRQAQEKRLSDWDPAATDNAELSASLELAAGLSHLHRGELAFAHRHLARSAEVLRGLPSSPYAGYLARLDEMLPAMEQIGAVGRLPEATKEDKIEKAGRIRSFWENSPVPRLLAERFEEEMLARAESLLASAREKDTPGKALARGDYAGAARLYKEEAPDDARNAALAEMCGAAEQFCLVLARNLSRSPSAPVPSLTFLSGDRPPAREYAIRQGRIEAAGQLVALRSLSPECLSALYAALPPASPRQKLRAREMLAVLLWLHGQPGPAAAAAEALRGEEEEEALFLPLWEQWMEAAGAGEPAAR